MNLELPFDAEWKNVIENFISSRVEDAHASGVILGLSGGVDSALVAKLCVQSIGKKKVHALILPDKKSDGKDIKDAEDYARELGISYEKKDISNILDEFMKVTSKTDSQVALGNLKARTRMVILYQYANCNNYLVVGTSNKTELLVGYFTKFGDGASDIMPIADLYKTQVWALSKELNLPEKIVTKVPTAGLWDGQTDEKELGITYNRLDKILYGIELGLGIEQISILTSEDVSEVKRIFEKIRLNWHKRNLALIPKLGMRTIGIDWRD